jgi:class 3 adenylate cyclase
MDGLHYADSEGHHLAYRVRPGAAGPDVVLFTPGGTIPMDFLERDRIGARLLDGLASIGRVVRFDRRGIGLSDPIVDWSEALVDQWADDLAAVVATACRDAPVVVSLGDYWGPARLFAARHPDALSALVLYEPTVPSQPLELTPGMWNESDDWIARVCPSRTGDAEFRDWFEAAGRTGASPSVAARLYDRPPEAVVERLEQAHAEIAVPTLVLRRPANQLGSPGEPDPVAALIPRGVRADLPGRDYHWLGEDIDSMLAAITQFAIGESRLPAPVRALCAVLFTDIVGSTEHATSLGDARWKEVLDRHDAAVADEVTRNGGTVIKSTGDGVLATLPSADRALRAAASIHARLAASGVRVRIGVHVGDVERRGTDVAGIAVHIAARVMAMAGPGEVLVTGSVPMAVTGTDHAFELVGEQVLRGVPGTWTIYRDVTTTPD